MIIDSHVHIDIFEGEFTKPEQRINELLKLMAEANIDKSVILESIVGKYVPLDTEQIIELIKNNSKLYLIGSTRIYKNNYSKINILEKKLEKREIIGIKLYPSYELFFPQSEECTPIYDLCEHFDVPVMFHGGDTYGNYAPIKYSLPLNIDEVACKRPEMKIIIAHAGNPWFEDTMVVIGRHQNVFADLSGLIVGSFEQPLIKYQRESINKLIAWNDGTEKLLFGSDWPINNLECKSNLQLEYIKFIKSLDITKNEQDNIFYRTAQRVFKEIR